MPDDAKTPTVSAQLDATSIKAASSRGLVISSIAQVVRFAIQFLNSVLMARLLLPADFGLVAMAAPLVAFVQLLADLGLTQATVQRPSISQSELSFLFWIGLAASVVIGATIMLAAPLAADFYHEPRVAGIVMAMGAIVMMSGAYAQHNALLNRSLRFGAIAIVEVGSFSVGAALGILAAWAGWSYWAIVVNQAAASGAMFLLAWILARWVPSRPRSIGTAKALLGFGGNMTAFNLVNFFARNLDNILIGRFSGEAALGLYDRAYKLLLFPLSQITAPIAKIANPVLARSLADHAFYRRAYFRLLDVVLLMTYPMAIFAGINNHDLIYYVLGRQWIAAAPIFAVLAIGALFAPISNSTGWLLVTQGRTRELRNYGALSSLAFILSFVVGLHWGALGVARCYIAAGTVQGPLNWWAITRRGPVSFGDLLRNLAPYALASGLVAILDGLALALPYRGPLVLLATFVASYALFGLGMMLTRTGRHILAPYWDKLRDVTRWAQPAKPAADSLGPQA